MAIKALVSLAYLKMMITDLEVSVAFYMFSKNGLNDKLARGTVQSTRLWTLFDIVLAQML